MPHPVPHPGAPSRSAIEIAQGLAVRFLPAVVRRKAVWLAVRLTQPRFLVGVCTLLRSSDGRVLLFEHRFWEDGKWGVPAGHMKPWETPQVTAERELREESGLVPTDLRVAHVEAGQEHRVEIWLTGRIDAEEAPGAESLDTREIIGAALLPPEQALTTVRPGQARVMRMLLDAETAG